MKTLIVYYSLKGNTKYAASRIAEELDADMLRIEPTVEYEEFGVKKYMQGGKEALLKRAPELKAYDIDIDQYDRIILATPVWASNVAPPLRTFYQDNDLTGKKIGLLVCSQSGRGKRCINHMRQELSDYTVDCGLSLTEPGIPSKKTEKCIIEFCNKLKKRDGFEKENVEEILNDMWDAPEEIFEES